MPTDWIDLPFAEAVAYLRGLHPMTDAQFAVLEAEAAAQAFTVARVTKLDALQAILDALTEGLAKGLTLDEFIAEAGPISQLTDGRLANVYQTNIQSAYGSGKWQQGTDPDIADEIWGWEFGTTGDDRVRDEHAALDGRRFKLGEGDEFFPPLGFGCRCSARWILKSEIDEDAESDTIPADVQELLDDSGFVSPAVQSQFRPDLTGYDPRLLAAYRQDHA